MGRIMTNAQSYHFNVGKFQCVVIRDGGFEGSANFLFTNAQSEELIQILQKHHLEREQIPSSWNCLFIDTGDKKILIDTGFGSPDGRLFENLQELGILVDQIDLVILSHGHPDHIGGCTDSTGQLMFPNARFVLAQDEWDFWTTEENLTKLADIYGRFARKNLPPLEDRVDLVVKREEIYPGITIIMAPGHTPGHSGLEIVSEGDKLFYLADAALHPIHIERPDWVAGVDMDPERVVTTRHLVLERLVAEKAMALFYHFDFPGLGTVSHSGKQWCWQPLAETTDMK
jgi:glyoxylase-like metal-dependent hydrolase (beta-lactamase superfamily II)